VEGSEACMREAQEVQGHGDISRRVRYEGNLGRNATIVAKKVTGKRTVINERQTREVTEMLEDRGNLPF